MVPLVPRAYIDVFLVQSLLTWTRLYSAESAQSMYYFRFVVRLPTKVASSVKALFLATTEVVVVDGGFGVRNPLLATYPSAGSTVPLQRY